MVVPNSANVKEQACQIEILSKNVKGDLENMLQKSVDNYKTHLLQENEELKNEIDNMKKLLIEHEDKEQIEKQSTPQKVSTTKESSTENTKPAKVKEKESKVSTKGTKCDPTGSLPVDVSRLDFRIGKIVSVEKHEEADSLYIEKINLGESEPRTIISGLVRHMSKEELQNKLVVVLCNLKPVKMRGILSQGMVMCASTPEKVEVLIPPEGCVPGDLIEFEGHPRNPDVVLNPKKKVFETCAPDLKTNEALVATYKGVPFTVAGKGQVTAKTLANVAIK